MALREVKPLSEKQWETVSRMTKSGPTDQSIQIVRSALERANKLRQA